MARKIREKDTDLYDTDLVTMIDEKLDNDNTVDVLSSMVEQTDDTNLDEVYNDLNIQIADSKDTTRVAQKQQHQASFVRTRPNIAPNPFSTNNQEEMQTYNDVVNAEESVPRMDVRPFTPVPVKKSRKRFKLWLISGVCAFTLLVSATLIGVLGLGAGAGTNVITRSNVETGELASDEGIVNKTDSPLTEQEINDWLSNGRNLPHNTSSRNLDNITQSSNTTTSSSMWDKICNFFSHLFGG